jgi:hypothetical protein
MKMGLIVMFFIAGMSSGMAQQPTVSSLLVQGYDPVAGSVTGEYGGLFLRKGNEIFKCNVDKDGSSRCIAVR